MTEDEFKGLFTEEDIKDVTDVFKAIDADAEKAKAAAPKKSGVWYSHNEQNPNGHTISVYALNMGGKTIAWLIVDNDLIETNPELVNPLGNIPEFVTPHRILVQNGTRTDGYFSRGIALRYPQMSGVHVDTNTIRAYVMPRLPKIVGRLYGI